MSEVTKAEIETLVTEKVIESKTVEYKERLYGSDEQEKREFLADVTAFANSQGGKIYIGISEEQDAKGKNTGVPLRSDGVAVDNFDQYKQRLFNWLADINACDPPLKTVDIYAVDGFFRGSVVVIDIRKSWIGPHRVSVNKQAYFYLRTSVGKSPMDTREIRQAFLQSDEIAERMKRWRAERVSLVSVGQGQIPNVTSGMAVVHVIPLASFTDELQFDVTDPSLPRSLPFAFEGGQSPTINFDGIISTVMPDHRKTSYSQLWRNGVFEGVNEVGNTNGDGGSIAAEYWEDLATKYVLECLAFLSARGISRNVFVALSLTGCLGRVLWGERKMERYPLDRDILLLPEIDLKDTTLMRYILTLRECLAPAYDVAYQAVGLPRSPYFVSKRAST